MEPQSAVATQSPDVRDDELTLEDVNLELDSPEGYSGYIWDPEK